MLFHHGGFFSLYYFPAISHSPAYLLLQENISAASTVFVLNGSPGVIREIYYVPEDHPRYEIALRRLQNDHGIIFPDARILGRLRNKFIRLTYPHLRPRRDQNNRPPTETLVMATAKQGPRCRIGGFFTQLGPGDAAVAFYDPARQVCSMAVVKNSDTIDVIEEILEIMMQEYGQEGGTLFGQEAGKYVETGEVTFYVGDKFKTSSVQQMERFILSHIPPPRRQDWWPQIIPVQTASEDTPTNILFSLENGAYFTAPCAHWLRP